MPYQLFCDGPALYGGTCDRPVAGHGQGKCSTHLRQLSRTGRMQPIEESMTPLERLLNAVNAWADADGDAEYESALRTVLANCKRVGLLEVSRMVRGGLERAKKRGVRLGRPRVAESETVKHLHEVVGDVRAVAVLLGVSTMTVRRALKSGTTSVHTKGVFVKRARAALVGVGAGHPQSLERSESQTGAKPNFLDVKT